MSPLTASQNAYTTQRRPLQMILVPVASSRRISGKRRNSSTCTGSAHITPRSSMPLGVRTSSFCVYSAIVNAGHKFLPHEYTCKNTHVRVRTHAQTHTHTHTHPPRARVCMLHIYTYAHTSRHSHVKHNLSACHCNKTHTDTAGKQACMHMRFLFAKEMPPRTRAAETYPPLLPSLLELILQHAHVPPSILVRFTLLLHCVHDILRGDVTPLLPLHILT